MGVKEAKDVLRGPVLGRVEDESSYGECVSGGRSGPAYPADRSASEAGGKPPTMEAAARKAGILIGIRASVALDLMGRHEFSDEGVGR